MKHITSVDNPLVKSVTKLKTKKGRQQQQQFISEGLRTCNTIIESGLEPIYIFATEAMLDKIPNLIKNYPLIQVTQKIMEKMSPTITPSGLLCVFPIPEKPNLDLISEGIVLANIQDPGNMGTLIRTAAAFGKKTVILVDGVEPWNPKVVQSSVGTLTLVNIFQLTWQELLNHKKQTRLVALVVKDGKPPQSVNFDHSLLIIGSEAHGIPQEWLNSCDEFLTIPMPGGTESLNAASAGAIAIYLAWSR